MLARDCQHETHTNCVERHSSPTFRRVARRSVCKGRYQVTDEQFRVESVDRALEYLKSKDALDKLSEPVPMLWGYVIMLDSLEQDK